ncbi:CheR family methyltransferase [Ideonella sp. A 288]|uniref:CheR family methyltransferase n=1 Tax=Ideonella sp. A 288 TaxID=1962181 RepID=UPI0013038885|nr:CheR family methyltransferase [Ideonella sp. A 288]
MASPLGLSRSDGQWVVAVGASAGGLEALQRFFADMTSPTNAAFVVLQHLSADHKSMMIELLGRHTSLPVRTAQADEPLLVDNIYLLPAGVMMRIESGRLAFAPKPPHGVSLPIDLFFHSLAEASGDHAIAVVLSGSGSDGAAGAPAVRAAGGYVLVQSPESAKFDSMPRSAVAATQVDVVAAPEELAAKVLDLTHGRAARVGQGEMVDASAAKPALQVIYESLERNGGLDFSEYKLPTVMRRIERRMMLTGSASVIEYADRVAASAQESEALRRELLIPVTSFFRDPEAFAALRQQALEAMVASYTGDRPLRVWCAGCATGEEAYTLAISLLEVCHGAQRWPAMKVFATDVDQRFLDVAGQGSYPIGAAAGLTQERLARWFTHDNERIVVKPELRQMVLFARHNLLEDAPFTKMDLVVCRNTLIYFQAEPQQRVMRRLQYALNPRGVLFLGSSESLGALQPDFTAIDAKHKLYRLIRPVLTALALHDGFTRSATALRSRSTKVAVSSPSGDGVVEAAGQCLMRDYVPASLLVNAQRQIVHAWGPTQTYLRVQEGGVTMDALRLMPPRLAAVAGHALNVVMKQSEIFRSSPTAVDVDGVPVEIIVVARAMQAAEHEGYALLSLEPTGRQLAPSDLSAMAGAGSLDHLALLERELADTRLNLESGIEELKVANEELQSTNEELMSSNEELQSTNEELQSVNEELYTVNAEYNAKLETVNMLMADLEGMSQATGIATLFVDEHLMLTRFTAEATTLFRLRPGDVGRSIEDFSSAVIYPQLVDDLRHTMLTGERREREVLGPHGVWYLARVLSYGQRANGTRRMVMSFVDVSRVRDARRMQVLIDALPLHVAVLDAQGTVQLVNHAWIRFAEDNGDPGGHSTGVGVNCLAVLARSTEPQSGHILRGLQQVLDGAMPEFVWTYPCHSPLEQRWFTLHARALAWPDAGLVLAHYNVTDWVSRAGEPLPLTTIT